MNLATAMKTLESKGKASAAKSWARHGVKEQSFGVSQADLGALTKKIGVDHELALALWKTGNHDARVLATRIADPSRMTRAQLDGWIGDAGNYVIAEAITCIAGRMPEAGAIARAWMDSDREFVSAAGWTLLGVIAQAGGSSGLDGRVLLKRIRETIHAAPNRTRHSMNMALIGIGGFKPELREEALVVAKAIGKVEVDHGDTDCKTPDAAAYIGKIVEHAKRRAAKTPARPASRARDADKPAR
jgi:3-methyladenine DNA glycosylase AlkD